MKQTPNLSLNKPEGTDVVNIDDLNANMDVLDAKLGTSGHNHNGTAGQGPKIAYGNITGTPAVVSTTADGLAPKRDGNTTKFLRGDGTWAAPTAAGVGAAAASHVHDDRYFTETEVNNLLANKQPLDATLTKLAALATAANQTIYSTGADAFAMTALSAFARTLLDDADAAAARATLGAAATSHGTHVPAGGSVSTFLRGDLTWQAITSMGGIVAGSLAENGYVKFANGLILQWINWSSGSNPISFPIAFPNMCLIVIASYKGSSDWNYSQSAQSWTNTNFNLRQPSRQSAIIGIGC